MVKKKALDFSRGSPVADIVKAATKLKSSGFALDLGSGIGRHAVFLAQKGFSVVAVDNNARAIARLRTIEKRKKLPIRCTRQSILSYRPKKKVDLVVAINSLHFLKGNEIGPVIKKIKNYTAAGGLDVIAVHTDKNPASSRPHLFKKNELKKFYSNWEILKYHERLGAPFITQSGKGPIRKYKAEIIAKKPQA